MPPSCPQEKDQLDRKLLALHNKTWLPPELLDLVAFTCHAQEQSRTACTAPTSLSLQTEEAHKQGAPLLTKEDFPVHHEQCTALFIELLNSIRSHGPLQEPANQLYDRLGLEHGTSALQGCFDAVLRDQQSLFDEWAAALPAAPHLLRFLTYNSLVPSLRAIAQVAHAHSLGLWQHGHCPICGSAPFMGYLGKRSGKDRLENLQDTNGQRFHVCSFCRTEYRVKRLQCPFCLEEDNSKLEYFSAEEEPGYQVHVCHSCKGYIKIADFREYTSRPLLPALDDLESLPLDIAAQQQGFSRLTLSPWGF